MQQRGRLAHAIRVRPQRLEDGQDCARRQQRFYFTDSRTWEEWQKGPATGEYNLGQQILFHADGFTPWLYCDQEKCCYYYEPIALLSVPPLRGSGPRGRAAVPGLRLPFGQPAPFATSVAPLTGLHEGAQQFDCHGRGCSLHSVRGYPKPARCSPLAVSESPRSGRHDDSEG